MNDILVQTKELVKAIDKFKVDHTNYSNQIDYLKVTYENNEHLLLSTEHMNDMIQALLRVNSGKILNHVKSLVKKSDTKWEVFALEHFPMGHEERKIRMKAAKLIGIESYYVLGWKRIKELAKAVDVNKKLNYFDLISSRMNYTIDLNDPDDIEMFRTIVEAFIISERLKSKYKINIALNIIVDAVDAGVNFDSRLIKKLQTSANPAVTLYNMIDFETPSPKSQNSIKNELGMFNIYLEKVIKLGLQSVHENKTEFLGYDLVDDVAHVIRKIYEKKLLNNDSLV